MNKENRPLVTNEIVGFEKYPVQVSRLQKNYGSLRKSFENIPQINNGKLKDVNM